VYPVRLRLIQAQANGFLCYKGSCIWEVKIRAENWTQTEKPNSPGQLGNVNLRIQFEMDERDIFINNRSAFSATEACKADVLEIRGCADKEKSIVLPKRE